MQRCNKKWPTNWTTMMQVNFFHPTKYQTNIFWQVHVLYVLIGAWCKTKLASWLNGILYTVCFFHLCDYRGHDELPAQTMHYYGQIPQTFAVFDLLQKRYNLVSPGLTPPFFQGTNNKKLNHKQRLRRFGSVHQMLFFKCFHQKKTS